MITALHGEGVGRPKLLQHYTGWGGALRNPKTKVSEYVIHGHWTAPTVLFSENEVISRNIK